MVLLDLGVLFLLMLVPLTEFAAGASSGWATGLGSLLTQANTVAFEIGQATLGFGALFLTWFLLRARSVPRTLAAWGVIGYVIHIAGAIAEIFGIHVGLMLSLPGAFFELAFGFWLIAKGFNSVVTIPRRGHADGAQASATSMAPAR